jgi:SAM-dependent methyltransferase
METHRASGCRFCAAPLEHTVVDLGMSPIANSYLSADQLGQMEPFYPLRCLVCANCFLVQLEEYESPQQIFTDYAYFSSYSTSWVEHARRFAETAVGRFGLGPDSLVVEVASNDGYLLQWLVEAGVPVLGIEPAANVAEAASARGVRTLVKFFGRATAREVAALGQPDLLIGNNVLAHVPDLNDFVAGLKILLAPGGVISMEFPHLLRLMEKNEWDTIYHEHFSYFSCQTVSRIFESHGLRLFDVEELSTHGGSLRIYACHADAPRESTERPGQLEARERDAGLDRMETYLSFGDGVKEAKWALLDFLIEERRAGRSVVAYGAPAKGNTLLSYCGVGRDLIDYTVDMNPVKQGRFLPGTHIPIRTPDAIEQTRPDLVLILPWNLEEEITEQLAYVRDWGGRLAVPIPRVRVLP